MAAIFELFPVLDVLQSILHKETFRPAGHMNFVSETKSRIVENGPLDADLGDGHNGCQFED